MPTSVLSMLCSVGLSEFEGKIPFLPMLFLRKFPDKNKKNSRQAKI